MNSQINILLSHFSLLSRKLQKRKSRLNILSENSLELIPISASQTLRILSELSVSIFLNIVTIEEKEKLFKDFYEAASRDSIELVNSVKCGYEEKCELLASDFSTYFDESKIVLDHKICSKAQYSIIDQVKDKAMQEWTQLTNSNPILK